MASIIWMSVFILLVCELVITLLLVLPLPRFIRRFLAKKIFTYGLAQRFRFAGNFIFFGLLFAVADAVSSLRYLEHKEDPVETTGTQFADGKANYITSSIDKQRKFRAERNVRHHFSSPSCT